MTLLQVVRDPGGNASFTFAVDDTVANLSVYITGQGVGYSVSSPTGEGGRRRGGGGVSTAQGFTGDSLAGETQQSGGPAGSLVTATAVGNFINLKLKTAAGQWRLNITTSDPYTVRVLGEDQ